MKTRHEERALLAMSLYLAGKSFGEIGRVLERFGSHGRNDGRGVSKQRAGRVLEEGFFWFLGPWYSWQPPRTRKEREALCLAALVAYEANRRFREKHAGLLGEMAAVCSSEPVVP